MALVVVLSARTATAAEPGRPPIQEDLPFWGILTFIGFLWVCKKLLWDWWLGSMRERERQEAAAIEAAEREHRTAGELLSDRIGRLEAVDAEIREILAEAGRDAAQTRDHILESARREAEAAKQRALREIRRSRDQALSAIFAQVTTRTIENARQRLATQLGDEDQRRLIDESLTQFRQQAG
ncbi:MAG: hypothetical protein KY476_18080 [Planctomycetes bacterium]|nr:hypothetical protein [Planctomycetota bacterium]